jgi:hypothetical protein
MPPDGGPTGFAPDVRGTGSDLVSALKAHVETLKTDFAASEARVAAERERAAGGNSRVLGPRGAARSADR